MSRKKRRVRGFPAGTVVLRATGCRMCGGLVYVCEDCAVGQLYCSLACRRSARRRQTREANRRYLATAAGKQRNRERQQRFRERRNSLNTGRVPAADTSPSSQPSPSQDGEMRRVTEQPMPASGQMRPQALLAPSTHDDPESTRAPRLPWCVACGRSSNVFNLRMVPSPASDQRRWRHMLRRFRDAAPSTCESVQKTTV